MPIKRRNRASSGLPSRRMEDSKPKVCRRRVVPNLKMRTNNKSSKEIRHTSHGRASVTAQALRWLDSGAKNPLKNSSLQSEREV